MSRIELIGISGHALTADQWPLLRRCAAIVASRRYRPLVAALARPVIDIAPLPPMLSQLEEALALGDVAVLASGDPLLYGIGRTLIERFGPSRITIHPALSAVQLACARFRTPWDDLPLLSLHGRSADNLPGRILRHQRAMLFTDGQHSPDRVAAILRSALSACEDTERLAGIRLRVAENLGLADERLTSGSLETIAAGTFSPLNLVLIEQSLAPPTVLFGLGEEEIAHSRGLITKDEVRAATLHRLRLPDQGVFWDIGGGSGSVSLEAARLCPELAICTIEKKPEEQANIRTNIRRFGAYTLRLYCGEAPEILQTLPNPDRVFIGGSGRRLPEIIDTAAARLVPGGRMVINAVLPQTEATALACLQRLGLRVTAATLAVSRRGAPDAPAQAFNPITLITGDK